MEQSDKKKTGRFLILVLMALTIFAISIWGLLQSLSYIKGAENTLKNQPENNEIRQIDMDKLGKDILSQVQFETELKPIDETVARNLLEVSESSKLKLYMGNGNYSDELVLITSPDTNTASSDQTILQQYLNDTKKSFDTYIPEQAKKISDAVIRKKGCYIVACVTNDTNNAIKIIQSALEGDNLDKTPAPVKTSDVKTDDTETTANSPQYKKIYSDENVISYPSGVIIIGDTAYEQYDYIETTAAKYADTVNNIAVKLKGKADIYSIIIPTSIGITLPDNKKKEADSSNQKHALKKIISKISDNVNIVPLYDELMNHRKEYIYFRTDHHWTAKGAYYAYASFCKSKQITPNDINNYKKTSFGSFAGSFYKETEQSTSLKKDEFYVYYPINNKQLTLEYTNSDDIVSKGNVIENGVDYGESLKYSAFIDGDNPFTFIENAALNNGSSCVVIKESFGNSLIPYLADHYQKIYVIDYRYWNGNLVGFIDENHVDDVIIVNNISMTRNSYQVGKLALLVEG